MTEPAAPTPVRAVPHDEAKQIAQRLINSAFGNDNRARFSIPCRPDHDDDCLIMAYIDQQTAALAESERRVKDREARLAHMLTLNKEQIAEMIVEWQRAEAAEQRASALAARLAEAEAALRRLLAANEIAEGDCVYDQGEQDEANAQAHAALAQPKEDAHGEG